MGRAGALPRRVTLTMLLHLELRDHAHRRQDVVVRVVLRGAAHISEARRAGAPSQSTEPGHRPRASNPGTEPGNRAGATKRVASVSAHW